LRTRKVVFIMERRLQRKFEWKKLPAVLVEELFCLHGAGVELNESIFLLGRYGHREVLKYPGQNLNS